ncbi:hypothetical protein Pres01_23690 [Metapseudomonas resinovorans]|nr:hypothetical protein Pres01_23690 [Pseudomonas resinovorans]
MLEQELADFGEEAVIVSRIREVHADKLGPDTASKLFYAHLVVLLWRCLFGRASYWETGPLAQTSRRNLGMERGEATIHLATGSSQFMSGPQPPKQDLECH